MRLVLGNSFSRLEGLSSGELQEVKNLLSYTVEGYQIGRRPTKRYLIDKKGQFPSGLVHRVLGWLAHKEHSVSYAYKRPQTRLEAPGPLEGMVPLAWQEEAVNIAVCGHRGVIQAATGTGKSIAIALLIRRLGVKTLVITPNLELKHQLARTITQVVGDSVPVTVQNIDSNTLETATDYDMLILDESHHAAARTYRRLNAKKWVNIYYRYCFTATSFRNDEEEQLLMESVTGPVIYSIPYKRAVAEQLIVPVEAYYYDLPVQKMKGNPRHWPAVYSELVVHNQLRNSLLLQLLANLKYAEVPTLCLVKEVAHGQLLSDLAAVPFANGEDGLARQRILEFCLGEETCLVGTIGILGEGVDTKAAEWVIMAGGGKAKTQFMQQVGRGVRTYPGKTTCKVVLFRDASNPWLLKHFNACNKHLKDEYGVKAINLDYPDELRQGSE